MRRFFALPAADQLRGFEQMRDFLGASAPVQTDADRQSERERESLAALEQVRDHLGLNGRAPTVKEFDRAARELGLAWTGRKVGEAWGRYRFACDALLGGMRRLSAAQLSLRHLFSGRKREAEDYVTALRLWAATNPPLARLRDYNAWGREYNDSLGDGDLPVPLGQAIRNALAISWLDALAIGRGSLTLEDATRRRTLSRKYSRNDWTTGPHDLVSLISVAQILELAEYHCVYRSNQPAFPTPVAIFGGRRKIRAWLREDVERYRDTGKAPRRRLNGLRSQYYGASELEPLVCVKAITNKRPLDPEPTGRVGGVYYWLKRDADRWIRKNAKLIERRALS
jgi:hypothetical protein